MNIRSFGSSVSFASKVTITGTYKARDQNTGRFFDAELTEDHKKRLLELIKAKLESSIAETATYHKNKEYLPISGWKTG